MAEKIGKYQIVERVGRGGMGMVYKAHDPMLDRLVALKVISNEIEVTEELRARFFREAQACARLSHPNIVTVYDMGEDAGRLFIVMEFLEGEDLRHFISQRKTLALEEKLSVMLQVCEGLHYAHQKGIVHRDIKPGNVLLLRTGQVKILDFGIAQIANTDRALTRTGLIMGTLRYIAPEQVRGRADHRSDIFSAGAVFYELLSSRPPFTGEDPMRLLEQLRAEDPPALIEVAPAVPPALAAIIERALRKEPAERFSDFDQMRAQLDQIRRELAEEAQRARARVNGQRDRVRELSTALAARLGQPGEEPAAPAVGERSGLETLQALERDLGGRIEEMEAQIARADSLAPVYQRGRDLLEAGLFADAAVEFESVVADLPQHAGALEGLAKARALVEVERRRQLAAELAADARRALDAADYAMCLEILRQVAEIPPPAEAAEELAALRQTAESALVAQAAVRRARQQAEKSRDQIVQARRSAQMEAGARFAAGLWNEAEARSAEAEAAFAREAYGEAGQGFDTATAAYQKCREAAREAQAREREAVERARAQAAQGRERAEAASAAQYAQELWQAAQAKFAEAQSAVNEQALGVARRVFDEALGLYTRAEQTAQEAQQRERADRARGEMEQARSAALAQAAAEHAAALWSEAEARAADGVAALGRRAFGEARAAFEAAAPAYRRSEEAGRAARQRQREAVEQARGEAQEARARAEAARAAHYARGLWSEAEARVAEAEAALGREAYGAAGPAFAAALASYHRSEEAAREAEGRERQAAEAAREQVRQAGARAEAARAAHYARELWSEAEARAAAGDAALGRGAYGEAAGAFGAALAAYRRGEEASLEAQQRERTAAERAGDRARQGRARAEAARAAQYAQELWREAEARAAEGEAAFARGAYDEAGSAFGAAVAVYRRSEEAAREAEGREREAAEQAAERARQGRARAEAARAAQYAQELWREAEAKTADGETAFGRGVYGEAGVAFEAAAVAYRRGEEAGGEAERRGRELAERAADEARQGRARAEAAGAAHYAQGQWNAAEAKVTQAQAALDKKAPGHGVALFNEATTLYGRGEEAALDARLRERRHAEEARHRTVQAQRAAEKAEAQQYAPAPWSEASAKSTEARSELALERYGKAAQAFDEALALYRQAEEQGREGRRREREHAEQRREGMAERRRVALAADANTHAPAEWNEAEASAAAGEAAFVGGGYGEASRAFEQGAALYQRAGERAREVVRAREVARAETEKVRQAASLARQRAAQVNASRYASEQWRTGEATEAQGAAALSAEDYAAARAFFAEARRVYAAATQAAGVGAEAEARRVTAMMRDARRLLESGDVAACLRRVGEVLTLRPGDTAAEGLRLRAEEELREGAAAGHPATTGDRGTDEHGALEDATAFGGATDERVPEASSARGVEAPSAPDQQTLVAAAAESPADGTAMFDDPTVLAEAPLGGSDRGRRAPGATVVDDQREPAAEVAEAKTRSFFPRKEGRAADVVVSPWTGPAGDAATSTARSVLRRFVPFRVGYLALGTAVIALALTVYWSTSLTTRSGTIPESRPPTGASAPRDGGQLEVEALRKRVAAGREAAAGVGAERLAAGTFRDAGERERAAERAIQRRDWAAARSQYAEALASYGVAAVEAKKVSALAQRDADAQRAREQVTAARRAAEVAGAPRLAAPAWTKAGESFGSAEDALKRRDFDRAESLFTDSAAAYREAEKQASEQKRAEAERAQREAAAKQKLQAAEDAAAAAASGRQSAERGAAPRYAPETFAVAKKKEEEARRGLSRSEYEDAESAFREAARGYQAALLESQRASAEAERQAALARQRQQQEAAETERQAALTRQRQQETAEAERRQRQQQQEEAERQAALARQRQQETAEAERQAALTRQRQLQEAAEAERQAALARQRQQQEAEQAAARRAAAEMRAKAQADRDQAVKAGADVYAKEVLAAADAKGGEGERLASGQDLAGATRAYRSAAERYAEAGRQAKVQQEAKLGADQARARMTAEKQRARQEAPDFNAAMAQERQATQQYQRAAFKEAGESFAAATALFAKAAARPAERPPRRPSPAEEVRGVLDAYVRAFETKDVALMQKVRPGLKPDEVRRLQDSFEQSKEYRLALKVDSLDVSGEEAVVKGRREDNLVSKGGQSFRNESTFTFRLKRMGDSWIIDAVK